VSLLRSALAVDDEFRLESDGIYLRPPTMSDFSQWSALREESREFLRPWEPVWPSDDLTRGAFRRRLKRYARDRKEGRGFAFLIFSARSDQIVGGATLSNVRRGVSQTCTLGYWMGEKFAGKRYMSRAVNLLLPFCFDTLDLHRIEAACLPNNEKSIRLLERAGFSREGYARNYLLINGSWQDHILYACLSEDRPSGRQIPSYSLGGKLNEIL